jgi:hypothetical protein
MAGSHRQASDLIFQRQSKEYQGCSISPKLEVADVEGDIEGVDGVLKITNMKGKHDAAGTLPGDDRWFVSGQDYSRPGTPNGRAVRLPPPSTDSPMVKRTSYLVSTEDIFFRGRCLD